ncbi:MAG TPA: dihydropteroate synthase [Chthonomonadaceae bacterium]|nr:dihydropteroate synthase [Chthonomonadaceae bacterium]
MLIVGERINTSRKIKGDPAIERAVIARDEKAIRRLAQFQSQAGCDYIDLNAGTLGADEPQALEWLTRMVQEAVPAPLCFDTPDPQALGRALRAYDSARGQPFINSISAETARYASMLPFALAHRSKVIALAMDDSGIQSDPEKRFCVAARLIEDLAREGVLLDDIYVDPLIFPIGSSDDAVLAVLEVLSRLRSAFPGVHTIAGLSNVSHGMPARRLLNTAMTVLCLGRGLDAGILDPTDRGLMAAIAAAEALLGQDAFCCRFLGLYRKGAFDGL